MNLLAFDTSVGHCAAGLLVGDRVVSRVDVMSKGQAEHLMGLLDDVLSGEGLDWRDLDAVGVGTGPGNFTGIRISVAAARGLALGLGKPAIGVSSFDAYGHGQGDCLVALDAPRGQIYLQTTIQGQRSDPALVDPDTLDARDDWAALPVLGPAAARLTQVGIGSARTQPDFPDCLVRAAAARVSSDQPRPAPMYLRPADAAPPRDAPPVVVP